MYFPRISIITITYNSERTVEETIKSVVSQNYPNIEYLIIDGGSKDKTLDIVEKYRDKISFVISEPDKGISDAFNKGIRYSTGEIIGIINSDDLLMPDALQAIAEAYDQSVDVYRGNLIIWNSDTGNKVISIPAVEFPIYSFGKPSICHPSTFVAKDAYDRYGTYRVDFKNLMDVDLLMKFYKAKAKFKHVNKELAVFRLGGVTSNPFWKKLGEVKNLYLGNDSGLLWAYVMVIWYIIYSSFVLVLKRLFSDDALKNWKSRVKHSK